MEKQVQNVSKQERWQSHIADWKISKLSQREYCELKQLSLNTFTYWRSKFKKSNTAETKKNNSLSAFQKVTFSTEKASKQGYDIETTISPWYYYYSVFRANTRAA